MMYDFEWFTELMALVMGRHLFKILCVILPDGKEPSISIEVGWVFFERNKMTIPHPKFFSSSMARKSFIPVSQISKYSFLYCQLEWSLSIIKSISVRHKWYNTSSETY